MRSFVGNHANTCEVANYFVTIVYLSIGYANMLKSIQHAELTLFDFVYTRYPSYSFAICHYQTCYNKYTKSVEICGSMSIIVVQVSGLQNAFIRNQCIRKSHGPESNGAVRNPLFRGIVH